MVERCHFAGRFRDPDRNPISPGVRIYAIGDIHGEAALLASLLDRIEPIRQDANRPTPGSSCSAT
jgi:hypothetical protein